MLDYLAANDEYIGWAAWAAGPRAFLQQCIPWRICLLTLSYVTVWGTFRSCCGDETGNYEPNTLTINGEPGSVVPAKNSMMS